MTQNEIDEKAAIKMSKNSGTPADVLRTLIGKSDRVDRLIARHPNANSEVLGGLSNSCDMKTFEALLKHPHAPIETIIEVAVAVLLMSDKISDEKEELIIDNIYGLLPEGSAIALAYTEYGFELTYPEILPPGVQRYYRLPYLKPIIQERLRDYFSKPDHEAFAIKAAQDKNTSKEILSVLMGLSAKIDRLIAKNPYADSTLKRSLMESKDKITRRNAFIKPFIVHDITSRARNPKELNQMRKLVGMIKINCPGLFSIDNLLELENNLDCGAWSWSPQLKEVPAQKINRCGDIFYGPLYTCDGYEWPMYKKLPMVPFIQLDLKRCSRVSGVDFGTGLLQVWFGFDSLSELIRVVPADQVSTNKLLAIPAFDMEKMDEGGTLAGLDWAHADMLTNAIQITGYNQRKYTLPQMYVDNADSGIDSETWKINKLNLSIKNLEMVNKFVELRKCAQQNWKTGTYLMGTFETIQWDSFCSLKKVGEMPLFCMESDWVSDHFNFGDGNCQILYKKDNAGKCSFRLAWNCF